MRNIPFEEHNDNLILLLMADFCQNSPYPNSPEALFPVYDGTPRADRESLDYMGQFPVLINETTLDFRTQIQKNYPAAEYFGLDPIPLEDEIDRESGVFVISGGIKESHAVHQVRLYKRKDAYEQAEALEQGAILRVA